jgi:porphobilinogen synthase
VASSLQGDQRTYQQDASAEALREIELDLDEGADIVMVKPALAYLDIVRAVADTSPVPVAAYRCRGSTR